MNKSVSFDFTRSRNVPSLLNTYVRDHRRGLFEKKGKNARGVAHEESFTFHAAAHADRGEDQIQVFALAPQYNGVHPPGNRNTNSDLQTRDEAIHPEDGPVVGWLRNRSHRRLSPNEVTWCVTNGPTKRVSSVPNVVPPPFRESSSSKMAPCRRCIIRLIDPQACANTQ